MRTMNRQDDMHYRNVAKTLGIPIENVTLRQRATAKQVCFGAGSEEDALDQLRMFLRIGTIVLRRRLQTTAPSPYTFQHSVRGLYIWKVWPRWRKCEIEDHIQAWSAQRTAIGGYEYELDEQGKRKLTLINCDARANLTEHPRSPYAFDGQER